MTDEDGRSRRTKKAITYAESDDENASDDSEEELTAKAKKPRPAKTKAAPIKKKKIVESDSDGEDSDSDKPMRLSNRSKLNGSRKKQVESNSESGRSSDSDEDDGSDDDDDDDANEGSDEDEDEGNGKSTKKRSLPKNAVKNDRKPKKKKKMRSSEPTAKQLKALTRLERLEEARRAYKWWEAEELPHGLMWRELEHPGVLFAPPYLAHGVPLLYDGQPVQLTAEQEEVATFFASIPEDGPQLGNPKTREVFRKNFFHDFKALLPPGHVIKKMDKCDFSRIKSHLDMKRSLKKAANEEEKAAAKKEKEALVLKYGYALVDGRIEKVSQRL